MASRSRASRASSAANADCTACTGRPPAFASCGGRQRKRARGCDCSEAGEPQSPATERWCFFCCQGLLPRAVKRRGCAASCRTACALSGCGYHKGSGTAGCHMHVHTMPCCAQASMQASRPAAALLPTAPAQPAACSRARTGLQARDLTFKAAIERHAAGASIGSQPRPCHAIPRWRQACHADPASSVRSMAPTESSGCAAPLGPVGSMAHLAPPWARLYLGGQQPALQCSAVWLWYRQTGLMCNASTPAVRAADNGWGGIAAGRWRGGQPSGGQPGRGGPACLADNGRAHLPTCCRPSNR